MNKKELIAKIAQESGLKKGEIRKLLSSFSKSITASLTKGEKVTISGFGSFVISQRKARIGVNPQNPKQKIQIPATATVRFRASKKLKEQVK